MEKFEIIFEKALSILNNSLINKDLKTLLEKLKSKSIDEILKSNNEIEHIHNNIREVVNTVLNLPAKTENEKVEKIAELISTEQDYLKRGIENGNVKFILIFLSVNCFLQVDIKNLLNGRYSGLLISDEISKLLQKTEIKLQILPAAPYYEKEMMKKYQQGITEGNIKSIYHFVEAVEMNGRGFHFNFLLEHLISFLYQLDYTRFLQHISQIDSQPKIIAYLQGFQMEQLIHLSNEPSLINKWLNFELIRQITEKERKDGFEEAECLAVKNSLSKISVVDFNFLKQTIRYFHSSILFHAGLGELLISFPDAKIQEILSDCFVIDKHNHHYKVRQSLLERFDNHASRQKMNILLDTIYKKWQSYYNKMFDTGDFYLNDLLLTDFGSFIALYYTLITTEEEIVTQVYEIISQLIWIDAQWFVSTTKQLTTFYLFYSKLYLLSFAYKEKRLKEARIASSFLKMKHNKTLLCRFLNKNTLESFKIIEENLSNAI